MKDRPEPEIQAEVEAVFQESEYGRYLAVEISGWRYNRLACRIHPANYHEKLRTFDKMMIFTTDLTMSTEEMVQFYNGKYEIESQFKQMNDPEAWCFVLAYQWTDARSTH